MKKPNFIRIDNETLSKILKNETRQYLVGNLKFPQTIKHIESSNVEIGISAYTKNEVEEAHYHTKQIEFQYMIEGKTEYINLDTNEKFIFNKGDFYCIETGTKYVQRIYGNTKILFIKLPAVNDKHIIEVHDNIKTWLQEHLQNSIRRKDYFYNDQAPRPNSIVPAVAAAIIEYDKLLMIRRVDNDKWSLPGGTLEYGESLEECLIREIKEETGLDIRIKGIQNIYSNPNILIEYANGEVRQEFTTVYKAEKISGELKIDDESKDIQWIPLYEALDLNMAESQRIRIENIINCKITDLWETQF